MTKEEKKMVKKLENPRAVLMVNWSNGERSSLELEYSEDSWFINQHIIDKGGVYSDETGEYYVGARWYCCSGAYEIPVESEEVSSLIQWAYNNLPNNGR